MLLGDRVGVVQLAAQRRPQPAVDLLGRAVGEHVVGGRDVPGERVGRAAELLLDEEPLHVRPALPAVLARVQPAGDLARQRLALDQRDVVGGEPPELRVDLARDQDLVDERARALCLES